MPQGSDLPKVLPLFPLSGAILLPRARLPLNVFEPRYLAMVEACLATPHRLIGMIQPLAADSEALHEVGCAGRLKEFSETEDGRYLITLEGVSRFHLRGEVDSFAPFRRAEVDWQDFAQDRARAPAGADIDRTRVLALLERFLKQRKLTTDLAALAAAQDEMLINLLAMLCPFAPEERQALLEAKTLAERGNVLESLLQISIYQGTTPEDLLQ